MCVVLCCVVLCFLLLCCDVCCVVLCCVVLCCVVLVRDTHHGNKEGCGQLVVTVTGRPLEDDENR